MPTSSTRVRGQRRAASAARPRPRSRAGSSARWWLGLRLLWRLLPLVVVLLVFIAAFTFDPEAVMRLICACVTGTFGQRVQIVGATILLCVVAATVWAFRPLPSAIPARQAKAVRRPAGRATPGRNASGKANAGKADSGKVASDRADSGKADPGNANSGKATPGKADSSKADSGRVDPGKAGSGKANSGKADPGKADPASVAPRRDAGNPPKRRMPNRTAPGAKAAPAMPELGPKPASARRKSVRQPTQASSARTRDPVA
jgi:hypothetical protein